MVKTWGALVSTPPLAVPPLSCKRTVTVATPAFSTAGVYVSVPSGMIAGPAANSSGSSTVTRNATVCADSLAGPELIAVAQPAMLCGGAFWRTA